MVEDGAGDEPQQHPRQGAGAMDMKDEDRRCWHLLWQLGRAAALPGPWAAARGGLQQRLQQLSGPPEPPEPPAAPARPVTLTPVRRARPVT